MTAVYTAYGYQDNVLVGVIPFERLELVRRHMAPSRIHMSANIDKLPADFLANYQSKISVTKDGVEVFTGRLIASDRTFDGRMHQVELNVRDGVYFLGGRLASPVPGGPPYTSSAHDTRTGIAETIIKQYVDYNCGPSATAARRFSWLTIETDGARGTSVKGNARFDNLLALCQELALAGGISFQVIGDQFKVFVPSDKSAGVRFSPSLGNVELFHYANDIAVANYFIVGGGGDLTSRTFTEIGNSASIINCGRWEDFADRRDTTDVPTMQQEAISRMESSLEKVQAHIDVIELPNMAFGTDFYLGDRVAIEIDGMWLIAEVQEHGILVNQDQQKERVEVGSFGTSWNILTRAPFRRYVQSLERRK